MLIASVWESKVKEIKFGQLAKVCFLRLEMKRVLLWGVQFLKKSNDSVQCRQVRNIFLINTYQKIRIWLVDISWLLMCFMYRCSFMQWIEIYTFWWLEYLSKLYIVWISSVFLGILIFIPELNWTSLLRSSLWARI